MSGVWFIVEWHDNRRLTDGYLPVDSPALHVASSFASCLSDVVNNLLCEASNEFGRNKIAVLPSKSFLAILRKYVQFPYLINAWLKEYTADC